MERPTFARSNNDVVEFVLSRVQSPHQRGLNQPPRQEDGGLTARQAADQLGHAKVSMTQDNYFGRKLARTGAAALLEIFGEDTSVDRNCGGKEGVDHVQRPESGR